MTTQPWATGSPDPGLRHVGTMAVTTVLAPGDLLDCDVTVTGPTALLTSPGVIVTRFAA